MHQICWIRPCWSQKSCNIFHIAHHVLFFSPPVLMHRGLFGIAFGPFVTNTRQRFISQEPFDLRILMTAHSQKLGLGKIKCRWAHTNVKLAFIKVHYILTQTFQRFSLVCRIMWTQEWCYTTDHPNTMYFVKTLVQSYFIFGLSLSTRDALNGSHCYRKSSGVLKCDHFPNGQVQKEWKTWK